MASDEEIRTAKAVHYRKVIGLTRTTASSLDDGKHCYAGLPSPSRDQELRKYDTVYPDIRIYDSRATYLSRLQHGSNMNFAQRSIEWEFQHPSAADKSPARDSRPERRVRQWEGTASPTPAPAMHPLWRQEPTSPQRYWSEHPPHRPLPGKYHLGERLKSRLALRTEKNQETFTAPGSPSLPPTRQKAGDQCVPEQTEKVEKTEIRQKPHLSFLTEEFLRDGIARNLEQADYLRDQRERREAEERKEQRKKESEKEDARRGHSSTAEKQSRMEDVPVWLKDLAKGWREKNSGSRTLFRKDFDFGPKTQTNRDEDYQRPLSPRSSADTLPKLSSEVCKKPLKRQRHDSTNTDVTRESPHDRLNATSSPIPIQRPQPTTSTSISLFRGLGALEVHPGERVNSTAYVLPEAEDHDGNARNARFSISDYDFGDMSSCRSRPSGALERVREDSTSTRPHVNEQDGCCEEDLNHRLETVFSQQGKLKHNAEEAQAALNEVFSMKTCKLQRKLRTTRDHPPAHFEPIPRSRTTEPPATTSSPIIHSVGTTNKGQTSPAQQDKRLKRRRSFVARCRSTDGFLRDVRESQRRRQLAREMEHGGSPRQKTAASRFPEQKSAWLGDDPL